MKRFLTAALLSMCIALPAGWADIDDSRPLTDAEVVSVQRAIAFIKKSGYGQAAARLLAALKAGKIRARKDNKTHSETLDDGTIVLRNGSAHDHKSQALPDPMDFGNPNYSAGLASRLLELAKTLLHEDVHTRQPQDQRQASGETHYIWGNFGRAVGTGQQPLHHEVAGWEAALDAYKIWLDDTLGSELKRELKPLQKISRYCSVLKTGWHWEQRKITDAEREMFKARIARLAGLYANEKNYKEIRNKLELIQQVAKDMRNTIKEYNSTGYRGFKGDYTSSTPERWIQRVEQELKFLNEFSKNPPCDEVDEDWDLDEDDRFGALTEPRGVLARIEGHARTSQLFTFHVTNQTDEPLNFHLPAYTQVAVPNAQDGMLIAPVEDVIPPGETRSYTPPTICTQLGTAPREGPIGSTWMPAPAGELGAGAPEPGEIGEDFEEYGFSILLPPPAVSGFMNRLADMAEDEGPLAGSPLGPQGTAQWGFWVWQGADEDAFDQVARPQLEASPGYRQADPATRQVLENRYIHQPFEAIEQAVEDIVEDISIDYTDAGLKAAVVSPSDMPET